MKKHRPTKKNEGGRNLFCSHYNGCLDYVVKKSWDSWNCSKCDLRNRAGDKPFIGSASSEDIAYYEFGEGFSSMDLEGLVNY